MMAGRSRGSSGGSCSAGPTGSTRPTTTANFEADPDNAFVWRMSKLRLEAEALRDALLFVGGRLANGPPVGSAVARVGEGLALFVRVDGLDASDTHRSVYLPVVRDRVLESLALFDFADPSLVTGERATTTGPAQALYLPERTARDPAGRGPRRSRPFHERRRGPTSRSGVSDRPRARADGRRAGPRPQPSFANSPHAQEGPIRHAAPGRRSARLSSPAPSSAIGIE